MDRNAAKEGHGHGVSVLGNNGVYVMLLDQVKEIARNVRSKGFELGNDFLLLDPVERGRPVRGEIGKNLALVLTLFRTVEAD